MTSPQGVRVPLLSVCSVLCAPGRSAMAGPAPPLVSHVPHFGEVSSPPQKVCLALGLTPTSLTNAVQLIFDHFVRTGPALSHFLCRFRFARSTDDDPGSWLLLSEQLAALVGWCLPKEVSDEGPPPPPQALCTPPLAPASRGRLPASVPLCPLTCPTRRSFLVPRPEPPSRRRGVWG